MAKRFKQIVKESFDLLEDRMSQLAVDMDELDDRAFKAKHKRSKQEMSTALNKPMKQPKVEMDEEVEQVSEEDDGWYTHKQMYNKVSSKDWKKGWRYNHNNDLVGNKKFYHMPTKTWHTSVKDMKEESDYLETDLKKRKKNNDKAIKDMEKMGSPMRNPAFGEEVEQIDEISQGKLMKYRAAASNPKYGKDKKKTMNRLKGYSLAGRKVNPGLSASMGKAPRVAATEEVDMGQAERGMRTSSKHTGGYHVVDSSGKVVSKHDRQRDAMQAALKHDDHRVKAVKEEFELDEASYKEGETRMGGVGPITTDAQRRERARKYRERLKGNQHKIDANDDGKISADDFKILRNKNKARYK